MDRRYGGLYAKNIRTDRLEAACPALYDLVGYLSISLSGPSRHSIEYSTGFEGTFPFSSQWHLPLTSLRRPPDRSICPFVAFSRQYPQHECCKYEVSSMCQLWQDIRYGLQDIRGRAANRGFFRRRELRVLGPRRMSIWTPSERQYPLYRT